MDTFYDVSLRLRFGQQSHDKKFSVKASDPQNAAWAALDHCPSDTPVIWLKIEERQFVDAEAGHACV